MKTAYRLKVWAKPQLIAKPLGNISVMDSVVNRDEVVSIFPWTDAILPKDDAQHDFSTIKLNLEMNDCTLELELIG